MDISKSTTVRFHPNGGMIEVEIKIIGYAGWAYQYEADTKFTNSSSKIVSSIHPLGLPKDLDQDIHGWTLLVDKDAGEDIWIRWFQDVNGIRTELKAGVKFEKSLVDSENSRLRGNAKFQAI